MEKEKQPTKQRILIEALILFSEKGYGPVTVAQIANAVGIKASSLYNHYVSKQNIFDAILSEMYVRYEKYAGKVQRNVSDPNKDAEFFMGVSEDKLIEVTLSMFSFFLHDDFTRKIRKMLTIEQYGNPELARVYIKQYHDDLLVFQEARFSEFVRAGFLIAEDAQIMALQYFAPILLYIKVCDSRSAREAEAVAMITKHIRQFNRLYKK